MNNRKESMILRFPEEDIESINALMSKNKNVAIGFRFEPRSRNGEIWLYDSKTNQSFDGYYYAAEILDLPRHVEEFEVDSKDQSKCFINKTADVSHIIIAHRDPSTIIRNGPDTAVSGSSDPTIKDTCTYRHGITPPTWNVIPESKDANVVEKEMRDIEGMERAIKFSVLGEDVEAKENDGNTGNFGNNEYIEKSQYN